MSFKMLFICKIEIVTEKEIILFNFFFVLFQKSFINTKDLYSRKDMNIARFNIDCMYKVCCVARTSEITHSAIR